MAGLVPAIHVFLRSGKKDVDARHKAGHDEFKYRACLRRIGHMPAQSTDDGTGFAR
jgi:hypothetical protein